MNPTVGAAGGQEDRKRVLVVEDDELLGRALTRMLRSRFEVVSVPSGREALKQISTGESFDAIVCDLVMPDMGGAELFDTLQLVAPAYAAKMVFITGGAFTPRARALLDRVKNPRLLKPFGSQELLDAIAQVLE